jgi:hypothetical protein
VWRENNKASNMSGKVSNERAGIRVLGSKPEPPFPGRKMLLHE